MIALKRYADRKPEPLVFARRNAADRVGEQVTRAVGAAALPVLEIDQGKARLLPWQVRVKFKPLWAAVGIEQFEFRDIEAQVAESNGCVGTADRLAAPGRQERDLDAEVRFRAGRNQDRYDPGENQ